MKKGKRMISLTDHKSLGSSLACQKPSLLATGLDFKFLYTGEVAPKMILPFTVDLLTQLWAPLRSKGRENDRAGPEGKPPDKQPKRQALQTMPRM